MARPLHDQLAQFLRKRRGDQTYEQFSRRVGLSTATLHRLEQGEQNATLKTLEMITRRLRCSVHEIFESD